eukprot:SAG31_NODE_105_length_25008_cov_17.439399_18_plen_180_part_00
MAAAAAALFHRDGFVAVTGVLDAAAVATIKRGCARVVAAMARADRRHRHRWSFGAGRRPWGLVEPEWSVLIDPPPLLEVLEKIFGGNDFYCAGCGGDFVLPGCTEYQPLHTDLGDGLARKAEVETTGTPPMRSASGFYDGPKRRMLPLSEAGDPERYKYVYDAGPLRRFHDPSGTVDLR